MAFCLEKAGVEEFMLGVMKIYKRNIQTNKYTDFSTFDLYLLI